METLKEPKKAETKEVVTHFQKKVKIKNRNYEKSITARRFKAIH